MNKQIDFKTKTEIETDIDRITQILKCDIFSQQNCRHPLLQAAFIELIIRLRDLLYKCDKFDGRVNFSDDVVYLKYKDYYGKEKEVKDITDAVAYIRNAACHIESELNFLDPNIIFIFNVAYGKHNIISTPKKNLTSDYGDDVRFFYGEQKLYLKRHIIRAFEESKKFLSQYLTN